MNLRFPSFRESSQIKKVSISILLGLVVFAGFLTMVTLVSKAHHFAADTIFNAAEANGTPRGSQILVLYSWSFRGSGSYTCSEFSFVEFDGREPGIVKIRVKQYGARTDFIADEVVSGFWTGFEGSCRNQ
jgi:hypothetical protein